ncbi:NUDIX domain-containing protein [Halomicroarcula sp. GCM10025817]|uniref:NUDIX domain-containing protein n=1 Tax=Haloarcula TaxID=2237 RepID=UPI0023E88AF5|nr:NUDIX domain-containing protein [Halomicroarcula sp. SYNS111]
MDERPVVTCFLRNAGEVLLLCRSDAVGSYQGQWGGIAGHVADDAGRERDPETAARAEIAEEVGLADAVTLVRAGEPFPVEDTERGTRWVVHPFLFDCDSRAVSTNEETTDVAWVAPPEIRHRETVPRLWTSYDRVRPRVETLRDDTAHGSAWLSLRALDVLRDEAALAVEGRRDDLERAERAGDDWEALTDLAGRLLDARPSMAVVANRVNRTVVAAGDEHTPGALEHAATGAIEQSVDADAAAAKLAARRCPDSVATLSRSGTVADAIRDAGPEAVLVAESRPGGEGVGVAASLAEGHDVTLTTDAAFAFELADWGVEALLVGADRILPDGRVVNKAGTRGAALAAAHDGIDVYVVAASDKVAATADYDLEPRAAGEVYDGDADLAVANPTFDVTPADAVTAVLTEQGALGGDAVASVAAAHREWAAWRE